MLITLFFWLLIVSIVIPFGSVFTGLYSKLCKENKSIYTFFDTFWLGLSILSALIVLLSLFFPINIYILGSIFLFTTLYTIFNKNCRNLYKTLFSQIKGLPLFYIAILFLTTLSILMLSCTPIDSYDMELYHLQNMIWSEQYSAVPGLANLHGRFAFNSSSILLSTLFSYHPHYYPVFFPLNGLCMYILVVFLIRRIRLIKDLVKQIVIIVSIFSILFFSMKELSSTSTDILPAIVVIYLIYKFLLDNKKGNELIYLVLPLFCCTLKLSSAPIAIFSLLVLIICIKRKEWRKLYVLSIISLIIILPWLSRYVILSGYLVYPFSRIDIFDFDWKVPSKEVSIEENVTYAWARIPRKPYMEVINMSFGDWIPIWFKAKINTVKYLIYLVLISPLIVLVSSFRHRQREQIKVVFAWFVTVIGLMFNFFTAPDPRFSYSFLILTAFLPFFLFSFSFRKKQIQYYSSILTACVMIYFISLQSNNLKNENIFTKPHSHYIDFSSHNIVFDIYNLDHIKLYTPIGTDKCFDCCIPCTPYLKEGLQLRGNSLQDGFKINVDITY